MASLYGYALVPLKSLAGRFADIAFESKRLANISGRGETPMAFARVAMEINAKSHHLFFVLSRAEKGFPQAAYGKEETHAVVKLDLDMAFFDVNALMEIRSKNGSRFFISTDRALCTNFTHAYIPNRIDARWIEEIAVAGSAFLPTMEQMPELKRKTRVRRSAFMPKSLRDRGEKFAFELQAEGGAPVAPALAPEAVAAPVAEPTPVAKPAPLPPEPPKPAPGASPFVPKPWIPPAAVQSATPLTPPAAQTMPAMPSVAAKPVVSAKPVVAPAPTPAKPVAAPTPIEPAKPKAAPLVALEPPPKTGNWDTPVGSLLWIAPLQVPSVEKLFTATPAVLFKACKFLACGGDGDAAMAEFTWDIAALNRAFDTAKVPIEQRFVVAYQNRGGADDLSIFTSESPESEYSQEDWMETGEQAHRLSCPTKGISKRLSVVYTFNRETDQFLKTKYATQLERQASALKSGWESGLIGHLASDSAFDTASLQLWEL